MTQLPSIPSISSTYLTPTVNSLEPSCCDYLVARISAIWQAFCALLSEWVGWVFSSRSQNDGVAWKQDTPLITLIKRSRENEPLQDPEETEAAFAQFAKELIDAYVKAGENLDDKYVTEFTGVGSALLSGGGSALHYAVEGAVGGNKIWMSFAPIPECLKLSKILIAHGVNLEVEDNVGRTPLEIVLGIRYDDLTCLWGQVMTICGCPDMPICGCLDGRFPDVKLADLLLRGGASSGAKFSKQDPTTLFEQASNLEKRFRSPNFDAMITAFMADRLRAIDESTPLPIPALRKIVSDYLCEGRFDPLPLHLKLSAELFSAEIHLSPYIRRVIIQYTLETDEVTAAISAQIESMPMTNFDKEQTREYFERHPIGIDPAANAAEVIDPPAAAAPDDDSDEE